MSKDYSKYSDWKLEQEYDRTQSLAAEKEMDRRGLLEDEDDDYEYEYEEKEQKQESGGGSVFSGIIGLIIIATVISLFVNPKGTIGVLKVVFMFIAYGILKLIDAIF